MKRAYLILSLALVVCGLVTGCEPSRMEYATLEWQKPGYDFFGNTETYTWLIFPGDPPRRVLCIVAEDALNEAAKHGWRVVGVNGSTYTLQRSFKPSPAGRFSVHRETRAMSPNSP